jgi:ketosteroid isomerase-like protein
MSAQENAALVRRTLEAMNAREFGAPLTGPVADDVEIHDLPRGIVVHGPKGFDQYHRDLHTAFPKSRMIVTNVQATDEQVFVEFRCPDAQNTGRLGLIHPTGRSVTLDFAGVYEIKDGKITKVRFYYDGGALMHQLGIRLAAPELPHQ